jgi:F-type H+-transporting ATPase subunit c
VRRLTMFVMAVMAACLVAPVTFAAAAAQAAPAAGSSGGGVDWVVLTAGFAMAIASFGGALGQGKATASACEALARNPGAEAGIRFALILGLVLIESMALYTFAMMFIRVVPAK